jgi:hypothetical protein
LFFFFFYFFLFPYSIQLYRPPTDAGIEPEESLPFGAVVHGGHVAQMLGRPAGARRSQIRSQDVENRSPTDGRRTGAAFRHDVDSARLNVKFQSRPKQMKNERKTRIVLTFIWEFFFGQGRERNIQVDLFSYSIPHPPCPCQSSCPHAQAPSDQTGPALLIDQITCKKHITPFL